MSNKKIPTTGIHLIHIQLYILIITYLFKQVSLNFYIPSIL